MSVIKETTNYKLTANYDKLVDFHYQIIHKKYGIVEKKGYCLPLMLHDINLLQQSLDKESLNRRDLENLEQLYEN